MKANPVFLVYQGISIQPPRFCLLRIWVVCYPTFESPALLLNFSFLLCFLSSSPVSECRHRNHKNTPQVRGRSKPCFSTWFKRCKTCTAYTRHFCIHAPKYRRMTLNDAWNKYLVGSAVLNGTLYLTIKHVRGQEVQLACANYL